MSCAIARLMSNVFLDLSGGDVITRRIMERNLIGKEIPSLKIIILSLVCLKTCMMMYINGKGRYMETDLETTKLTYVTYMNVPDYMVWKKDSINKKSYRI